MLVAEQKLNANSRDYENGRGPLYEATLVEDKTFIEILTTNNGTYNVVGNNGNSMIYALVANPEKKVLSQAILAFMYSKGMDPNMRNDDALGYTAMHLCTEINQLSTLEIILDQPTVDVNLRLLDKKGMTPLFLSSSRNATELLLTRNSRRRLLVATSDSPGAKEGPPVILGVSGRTQVGLLQTLAEDGFATEKSDAIIERLNPARGRALEEETAKAKKAANIADPLIRTGDHYQHLVIHENTRDPEAVEYLLANGLRENVDDRNSEWDSPLIRAAMRNDYRAVRVFLKWCANPNLKNRDFRKALDYAMPGSMVERELLHLASLQKRLERHKMSVWKPGLYAKVDAIYNPPTTLPPEEAENELIRLPDYENTYEFWRVPPGEPKEVIQTEAKYYNYRDQELNYQICSCDCDRPFASYAGAGAEELFFDFRGGCTGHVGCLVGKSSDVTQVECRVDGGEPEWSPSSVSFNCGSSCRRYSPDMFVRGVRSWVRFLIPMKASTCSMFGLAQWVKGDFFEMAWVSVASLITFTSMM